MPFSGLILDGSSRMSAEWNMLYPPLQLLHMVGIHALGGKSLFGRVDGTKAAPKTDNEKYGEWKSENQYTMSLLLNSMEPKIAEIFTFTESAKELWESVRDLYGHQNNAARIYQLQQNINNCKQGDRSFVEYLGELKSMWDELGLYRPPTTNLATLQQRAEQDKVFQLLAHIKPDFENLRGQILLGSGVPSLSSVCASIQQEETRTRAMNIEPKSTVIQSEASALMVDNKKVDTKKHSGNFAINKVAIVTIVTKMATLGIVAGSFFHT
ncbi:hypothetical protein RHSIM_Rhsim06G0127400 [Rhododendron simsii]|uniref:Retrotransposon gag domain-containing protein n=1 Tax=Rhododendron simsii TaxID=118357 RepID=A0A834LIC0_RHOSS|nr:hypothetical protein RHSIM_Rhsim06G0127400 [Rhododendron simsii]